MWIDVDTSAAKQGLKVKFAKQGLKVKFFASIQTICSQNLYYYLHVYCPRAPWSGDVQVKIMDGIPRSRKWAYGIKIATEKKAIMALFFLSGYDSI